jgi:16S rRNA (cytosine1402-N4)-methyltransferase
LFIDATGDGMLGALSGAEFMYGREDKSTFGEADGLDVADPYTMGNSVMFYAVDTGAPVKFTKPDWAYTYSEEDLANIIYEYGEERFSRQIAKNICEYRKSKEIQTTKQLVEIIERSIPKSKQNDGHPAKRTFQAIRIEVNDEIKPLYNTIKDCIDCLQSKGRLCVITFHSLEDRAVKNAMLDAKGKCTCPSDLPYCVCGTKSLGEVVNRKPIIATKEEQEGNSRSKSAKLRIFQKK